MSWTYADVAKMIDHALLVPTLTDAEVRQGLQLGLLYDVASVCIMPCRVAECAQALSGSEVLASTTIGFPHGLVSTESKLQEAKWALDHGCRELDVVVNLSHVKSGRFDEVTAEVRQLVALTHSAGQRLKLIFENSYLETPEKIRLCEISTEAKVDWVKTSTGFAPTGATADDVRLMRKHSGVDVQVKAAGGVRSLQDLLLMRSLGATRVGASATSKILEEARSHLGLAPLSLQGEPITSNY